MVTKTCLEIYAKLFTTNLDVYGLSNNNKLLKNLRYLQNFRSNYQILKSNFYEKKKWVRNLLRC